MVSTCTDITDIHSIVRNTIGNAAENGHLEVVKYLVSLGVESNYLNNAFDSAASNGHIETVKYFISIGVDDFKYNNFGLSSAASNGKLEMVKYLVSLGAYNSKHDSIVRGAAINGHLDVVKYLVSVGANVRANGDFAIRYATNIEVVNYLVSLGADSNNIENGHLTVVQLRQLCKEKKIKGYSKKNKSELIKLLL